MNGFETDEGELKYWMWLDGHFGAYRNRIKEKVTALYDNPHNRPLRFYTSHELQHCQAVEDLIHRLIPNELYKKLELEERFYLLASAWLHDIGMLSTVADRVWGRSLGDNDIRNLHHETAARFIRDYPWECGVEDRDKHFLAALCQLHRKREDLRAAVDRMAVGNKKFRFQLLAAYLRLADALHVDLTRAPDRDFTHCLAYNIPPETKLHWIKSRVVSGVVLNHQEHLIEVQFQRPSDGDIQAVGLDLSWVERKINAVTRYVMDELRDELASVMYVLTSGGVTHYLDVQEKVVTGVDEATLKHLLTLVMNYDVLVWPSASRLLEMILINLAELAGYQLRDGQPPVALPATDDGNVRERVDRLLRVLAEDLRSARAFHLGIRSLIEQCRAVLAREPFSTQALLALVDARYQQQRKHRKSIRDHADSSRQVLPLPPEGTCNILLYGYSELVIKALCGLRDRLIRQAGLVPKTLYGSQAELEFSRRFRFFICEGQPKTHTAVQDRLMYHDGVAYALALRQRNFTNLVLIPDIVLSSVTAHHHIDYLLVGANGFADDAFHHSAGHGSVIHLLRGMARDGLIEPNPRIVLVVSSDKYWPQGRGGPDQAARVAMDACREVDGYAFWTGANELTRDTVWLNRDPRVRADLHTERAHIQLFNPREDAIPIALVDSVICDCGVFPVCAGEPAKTADNIRSFLAAVHAAREGA